MVVGDPQGAQHIPLALAGRREDLRTEVTGDLDRRHTDTTGTGMDQDLLARLQTGEVLQRVVGGEEHQWHGRRGLPGPVVGDAGQQSLIGSARRTEPAEHHAHDPVAGGQFGDVRTDLGHDTGGFGAEQSRLTGVHAESVEHVAEVEARGTDPDAHLPADERFQGLRMRQQGETVEAALDAAAQPPRRPGRRNE